MAISPNVYTVDPIKPQAAAPTQSLAPKTVQAPGGVPQTQKPAEKMVQAKTDGSMGVATEPTTEATPATEPAEDIGTGPSTVVATGSDSVRPTGNLMAQAALNAPALSLLSATGDQWLMSDADVLARPDEALQTISTIVSDIDRKVEADIQAYMAHDPGNGRGRMSRVEATKLVRDKWEKQLMAAARLRERAEDIKRMREERKAEQANLQQEQELNKSKEESIAQRTEANETLEDWKSKASGEGLDDTAAQQQLAENSAYARDAVQDRLSGFGGRQSARAANIAGTLDARMEAEQARTSELLKTQEQAYYTRLAGDLGKALSGELAQADFADADLRARMADIYDRAYQAQADIKSSLNVADMMAEAQRKAAEDAAADGWKRTLIGGAFTLGGMAVGSLGGPVGTAAGGVAGRSAGDYFAGLL